METRVWYTVKNVFGSYLTLSGAELNAKAGEEIWKNTHTLKQDKLIKIEKELINHV